MSLGTLAHRASLVVVVIDKFLWLEQRIVFCRSNCRSVEKLCVGGTLCSPRTMCGVT